MTTVLAVAGWVTAIGGAFLLVPCLILLADGYRVPDVLAAAAVAVCMIVTGLRARRRCACCGTVGQ